MVVTITTRFSKVISRYVVQSQFRTSILGCLHPCPLSASIAAYHSAFFIDPFLNVRTVDFIAEYSFSVLSYCYHSVWVLLAKFLCFTLNASSLCLFAMKHQFKQFKGKASGGALGEMINFLLGETCFPACGANQYCGIGILIFVISALLDVTNF